MKKRVVVSLLAFTLLATPITTTVLSGKAAIANLGEQAEYVSLENAPTIDGLKTENEWANTCILQSISETQAVDVNILWNETGLYFFATIEDSTVNIMDRCNFWVSETYYDSDDSDKSGMLGPTINNDNNSLAKYSDVEGAYYLVVNPDGINLAEVIDEANDYYFNMTGKYTVAATKTETGYSIELFVSATGSKPLTLGNSIGFEVSVDDYIDAESERESYINCFDKGSYWTTPMYLGEIVLAKSTLKDNQGNDFEDDRASGCQSSVLQSSLLGVLALSAVLGLKKKRID